MKTKRRHQGHSYHHGDLRAALIAAATAMLEKDGPEAISFRAIARKVGVSQTAPYNHFQSKEHLLATVAAQGFRDLTSAQIATATDVSKPKERVGALGRAYIAFARAHPQRYRLMFGVGVADWRPYPEVAEAKKASYGPVQEALAAHLIASRGNSPEAVETAAVAAWALVHGLSTLLIDGALDPAKKADGNVETLIGRVMAWFVAGLDAGAAACGGHTATSKGK